jgi:glycopeptide antibiotics resistance protein
MSELRTVLAAGHLGALVNVAVFVPLGWLGYHAGRALAVRPHARLLLVGLAAGALSLAVEVAQSVAANRQAPGWSFVTRHGPDVALNVLGATAGALAAAWLSGRARRRRPA